MFKTNSLFRGFELHRNEVWLTKSCKVKNCHFYNHEVEVVFSRSDGTCHKSNDFDSRSRFSWPTQSTHLDFSTNDSIKMLLKSW